MCGRFNVNVSFIFWQATQMSGKLVIVTAVHIDKKHLNGKIKLNFNMHYPINIWYLFIHSTVNMKNILL